jgi:hypothetical protein
LDEKFNQVKKKYTDVQTLLEIPERLKKSTIACPYNLPLLKEADSAKSLQLLELIKARPQTPNIGIE